MICCLQPEPDRLPSRGVAQPRGDYILATKGMRHRWQHPQQPQCCYHSQTLPVAVPQPKHSPTHLTNTKGKAVQTPRAFLQPTPVWGTEPSRWKAHRGIEVSTRLLSGRRALAQGPDSQSDSRSTAKCPSTPTGTYDIGPLSSAKETYLLPYPRK